MRSIRARPARYGAPLVGLWVAACGHDSLRPSPKPVVFPEGPIELALGAAWQMLTQVGSSWVIPTPENGFVCYTRDTLVVTVTNDCIVNGRAVGSATVTVDQSGGKTDVQFSVADYPHFRVPDPLPGLTSTATAFVAVNPQGVGYVTGTDLVNDVFLWRVNVSQLRADSALTVIAPTAGAVAFNAAGTIAYAAGFGGGYNPRDGEGVVAVMDPVSNTITDTIMGLTGGAYTALMAPGDSTLYVGTRGHVTALDVRTHVVLADHPEPDLLMVSLALNAATNRLYATAYGGSLASPVRELDATTLAVQRTLVAQEFSAKGLLLSPDGSLLYVTTEDNELLVCPLGFQTCTEVPEPFCLGNDITLNAAGTLLYLGCGEYVRVIDPASLQTIRFLVPYGVWRLRTQASLPFVIDLSGFNLTLLP